MARLFENCTTFVALILAVAATIATTPSHARQAYETKARTILIDSVTMELTAIAGAVGEDFPVSP